MSLLDDDPGFLAESSGLDSSKFERDRTSLSVDFFGLDVDFVLSEVVVLGVVGFVVDGVVAEVDVGVVVGDVASVVVGVVVGLVDGVVVGDVDGVVDDGVVDDNDVVDDGVVVGFVDERVVVVA